MAFHWYLWDSESTQRAHTWQLIRRLRSLSSLPRCLGGDFNEILYLNEKVGGSDKIHNSIFQFRLVLMNVNSQIILGLLGHGIIEER